MIENKKEFYDAINLGREIEFSCDGVDYFESYDSKGWYIDNLSTGIRQYFSSCDELMKSAKLGNAFLSECWERVVIDYIL